PYRLAIEVSGVGFKTADRIARSQGLSLDHPERAQAGVLHQLRALSETGHCYCPRENLRARAADMLEIDEGHVDAAVDALWASGHLVIQNEAVFLTSLYEAERRVSARMKSLLNAPSQPLRGLAARLLAFE